MRWLTYIIVLFSLIYSSECQNVSFTEDELESMYHAAIAEVLEQHAEAYSRPRTPPYFEMPDDFMHSFVPGTGVGNREELIIDSVLPLTVFEDITFSKLLFKHFNNTDYVAGISANYMVLMKINKSTSNYLVLSNDDIVLTSHAENGVIKDVALFTRIADNTEIFSVAIATQTPIASVIYIHEVYGDYSVMVSVIDLNIDPSKTSNAVKKIAYVQSSYAGSLVVLTDKRTEKIINYNHRGHNNLNHFIEVNDPSATDLVTFTVHGHGYIAVSNNRYCEVYKMDEFVKSDRSFDKLGPFTTIVDLEYFRLGFHHFLAVAGHGEITLYTWKMGEMAPKQTMPVPNLAQVFAASVESCRDEVMLIAVAWDGSISLYVYSGENENFRKVDVVIPAGYTVLPNSLASFTSQQSVAILFVDFNYKVNAFVIKTSLKSLRDPVLLEGEEVSKVMKNIHDTIASQNKEIKRVKELMKDAVHSTGTQRITSIQHFNNVVATNGSTVENVNKFFVEWEDSALTLEEYKRGTADLEKTIESLERLIDEMERKIPDIVRLDEDTVITGQKIFEGEVKADHLVTTSLNLQNVAGIDLAQLQKDIYRLDYPEIIDGTLTFKEPLIVTGNFDVETTVNGIDISEEVMTTNTDQFSSAEMIFARPLEIRGNLDVSGKVNGIDISEEVVTLDGSHHITAPKNFLNGLKIVDLQTKFLDGIDIDELYNKAFTISGNQTITDDAAFASVTTNNIILKGKLNGYDVNEIADSIVRIDKPAIITELKTFTNDVKIDGGLIVHGTVNGLKIPDDLVLTDRTQVITGYKEFLGEVTAHDVTVHGLIDGLKLPEDVVTLSKDEEISSFLYFADGIVAEKDIVVEGHVDGVDISEVAKQAMKLNETNAFKHALFLGPVTVTGNLNVRGKINNIDLNNLLNDIVYKDEKPVQINVKKTFKKVFADKVRLDSSINGFNIDVDFMKVRGDQIISGTKTFKNTVFHAINIEDGMIDDVNITDLYQKRISIEIENEDSIDRVIEFVDNVFVKDLIVHGTINGLRIPEDVVLKNSNQSISNKRFTNRVTVDNLVVDGDINVDNFVGMNLTQFYNDRITLSGDQTITGDIWLGNTTASKIKVDGFVNGVDLKKFADNLMLKSKSHQVVTGVKEFSGGVKIYGDIKTAGINGVNISDINKRAFKLYGDNTVTAQLEFGDNVTLTDLYAGDINGINITRLAEDSLKKTGDIQYVKEDVVFEAGFDVVGDIIATKVNDLVLKDDILLRTLPQTITGQFTFKSMAVTGDLTTNGLINGLNLAEIITNLAKIDDVETVIQSNVTFAGAVNVQENIDVTGTVNDVDLKKLFENALTKTGDQIVFGHKIFRGNVTITGDIDVAHVNGKDWYEFLDDVVWINKPQTIRSTKIFKDDVSVDNMFVSGDVHAQTVNGKDLNRFATDAVFIDEPANITGPIVFKNPVEISGDLNADLINGLNLKTDVITITCSDDGPQVITGHKSFQNIKVFGDILAESVNSYDLQELYEDTLLTTGNQTVTGRKIIHGDVVFKRDVYPDTVNGMILNRDLVTLDTEQQLEGPLTFQGDVSVRQDMIIEGLLNGVHLYNLSRDVVELKTEQTIEGTYTFEKAVVLSDVQVDGLVNDMNLADFDRNVTEFIRETKESIDIMERYTEDQCQIAKYLQESLKGSYYDLDGFIVHQDFEFPASFVQVQPDCISLVYVDDSTQSTTSVKHSWDKDARRFSSFNFTASSLIKSLSYKLQGLSLTVNIGLNSLDSSVTVDASGREVVLQKHFVDASVVVRENDVMIALMSPNGTCDVYLFKEDPDVGPFYELESSLRISEDSTSVSLFELSGRFFLAVSSLHFPFVSGYSQIFVKEDGSWQLIQRIQASGSFVKHFEHKNYHYLAFANIAQMYETKEPKSIQIFRNTGVYGSMFVLFQKVLFDDAQGIELFTFGDLNQLHMVAWNDTRVSIYGLEGESGMAERFTIYTKCVRDVKPLTIANDLYLIVGRQNLEKTEAVTSVLYKGITKGVKYEPYSLSYC